MKGVPLNRKVPGDLEMGVVWGVVMFPGLFLLFLWTLISTPTAEMIEADKHQHYLCATGGFTGPPGGDVFFWIIVGYLVILI